LGTTCLGTNITSFGASKYVNEITSKAAYPYWIFNDVTESTKIGAQNLSHGAQWLLTALKSQ